MLNLSPSGRVKDVEMAALIGVGLVEGIHTRYPSDPGLLILVVPPLTVIPSYTQFQ